MGGGNNYPHPLFFEGIKMNFNQIKKIGLIGDSHGNWEDLIIASNKLNSLGVDLIIQVGDFGWWLETMPNFPKLPYPIYFIDGNHEHFNDLFIKVSRDKTGITKIQENLFYIHRGSTIKIGNLNFAFMGGGISIDRGYRKEGIDWFPEEFPSYREYNRLFTYDKKVDCFITHDAPDLIIANIFKNLIPDSLSKNNRDILNLLYLQFNPKFWFHGHYHKYYEKILNNTFFNGLGCAPSSIIFHLKNNFIEHIF